MERRSWVGGLVCALLLAALAYAGWRNFSGSDQKQCYACDRPVHAHSKALGIVNGHTRVFCCPACALRQHAVITQLTSYRDGKALAPEQTWFVEGSDVNLCERTHEVIDDEKRPADLRYDRCAPSLIAFGQRSDAVAFASEHGGEVVAFRTAAAGLEK